MSGARVFVRGTGAVSPAGWGMTALRAAMDAGQPLPVRELGQPASSVKLAVRAVPPANPRPAWLGHARLRRTSPISQYAVAAALEALGPRSIGELVAPERLGLIFCVMSGCVNYSRRFYDEVLRDPATASPLVFPETVFNAPSSHLAALLGCGGINYTLVGDPGTFLQGLALGADWLGQNLVDACLVVGAEETDWITSHAFRLFSRQTILGDGAGAVLLQREPSTPNPVELLAVTDSQLFLPGKSRRQAVQAMRQQLAGIQAEWLVDSLQNIARYDRDEAQVWADFAGARWSPKKILGEGLAAATAWQAVLAISAVESGAERAMVSTVGTNQQAIGAAFGRGRPS